MNDGVASSRVGLSVIVIVKWASRELEGSINYCLVLMVNLFQGQVPRFSHGWLKNMQFTYIPSL